MVVGWINYILIIAKENFIMTSDIVLDLYNWFNENGIAVWIDGGWCIDALFGKQTREHTDLDIAVHRKDNVKLRKLLENNGYKEEKRNDSSEFMYVMKNKNGKSVDIHVFEYDENGKNIYGIEYPFGSLMGIGIIDGCEVNCISPNFMFQFKTEYEPKEKDLHDVRILGEKFGFELPNRYLIGR
jgi:lincosamide nucleotidyltransferase A/C/D/E